jgi:hypothetical protein
MIEGSGSRAGFGSGSIPLTDGTGSGSRRAKICGSGGSGFGSGSAILMKIVGSGSISQRHGSEDLDPDLHKMSWIRNTARDHSQLHSTHTTF